MSTLELTTVVGSYAHTVPLKDGRVGSESVTLRHETVDPVHDAFGAMVNDLKFDVCEMAIATFLQAKAADVPLTLLPVVTVGRFQHRMLVRARTGGPAPEDLAGRTVGVRAYTVTTGMWVRGLLQQQYGVDSDSVTWQTYESPHVAGFTNPPNVLAPTGDGSLAGDAATGVTAAAIVGGAASSDDLTPVIDDPDEAARAWYAEHRVVPVNHLVTVRSELLADNPGLGAELVRMFSESKALADAPPDPLAASLGVDPTPVGVDRILPAVEMAAEALPPPTPGRRTARRLHPLSRRSDDHDAGTTHDQAHGHRSLQGLPGPRDRSHGRDAVAGASRRQLRAA